MIKYKKSKRYRIRLATSSKKNNLLGSTNSNHNYFYDKLNRYQKLRQHRLQKYLNETRTGQHDQEKDRFIKRPILSYLPSDLSLNTLNSSFYKIEDLTFTEEQDSDYVNMNNNNTLIRNKMYSSSPIDCSLKSFISLTTFTEPSRVQCETHDQHTQTNIDMNEMNRLVALMDKNLSLFNKSGHGNIDADGFVNFLIDFYFKSKKEQKKENCTIVEEKSDALPPAPKMSPNQVFTIQPSPAQFERRNDLLIDELKRALEKRNRKINQQE
ncbi:hypothetical protein BpHYR1_050878 [Brachionus plicatilis]|uniref:Uncharacterized protein n=1 Tax=Brachionus plicatilis TaxID=10195 RepID=A0A3M7P4M2_BRAPC|nr:hypothetical protein BpHYR1_050878 [Brachionus plicatilis]